MFKYMSPKYVTFEGLSFTLVSIGFATTIPSHDIKLEAQTWGVLILLKLCVVPDFVELVLGRISHFNIVITYSNSTFCGA